MNKPIGIILLALLGYACERPDQTTPETASATETLILVQDNDFTINALHGQTGQLTWSLPLRYDLTYSSAPSQLGRYTIADKKIFYYAKPDLIGLKNWGDTTALFASQPAVNQLGTINAVTGQAMPATALKISPGFQLPCGNNDYSCTYARYYYWLGVNQGVAILESVQTSGLPLHFDRKLLAINTESGSVLWTFKVDGDNPTATIDNGRVYIGDTHKSYVIDLKSGSKIQEYAIGGIIPPFTANLFFKPLDAWEVVVADAQTGAVKWRTQLGNPLKDLAIGNGLVLTKVEDRNLIQARDATTGTVKWSFSDNTSGGFISLQLVDNTLYTMSQTRRVYAIDLDTGALKWKTVQYGAPDIQAKSTMIYMMQTGHQLLGLNPATGEQVWERFFMRDSPAKTIQNFAVFNHSELDF